MAPVEMAGAWYKASIILGDMMCGKKGSEHTMTGHHRFHFRYNFTVYAVA